MNLIIDCSLNYLEIGLVKNNKIIDTYFVVQDKNLTKILIPSVLTILAKNHLQKKDIKSLYVVNGPGSFTSIKLIAILANAWKQVDAKINLYFINTCLWNIDNINCLSYLDAKSNKVYVQQVINGVILPIVMLDNDVFEKLKESFINKHKHCSIVDCNNKKTIFEKWDYTKYCFSKTNNVRPLYLKPAI